MSGKTGDDNTQLKGLPDLLQRAEAPLLQGEEKTAVALTYHPEDRDGAPKVAASGRGHLADRILEEARLANVPVREDASLVEMLAATEIGEEIPVEAFIAVAEILSYVYAMNNRAISAQPPDGGLGAAPAETGKAEV